ncbi:peptidylprolyl isomerase [Terrimonas pollutisoli]|uniref:peptidylprolyl isomerase n=1 Tax=Terrimonas pollutisoli TaxID=3034147 RepID=UPI0023EDA2C2|nr:SurA N-terminal domain-containing protein [Terrimonas sp. H1YJ31]
MSVIQKIQDKYAKLMAVVIAVALLTFVVMLAFENGGSLFRGNVTNIGSINGEKIDEIAFSKKIDQQEASMEQQGYPSGAATRQMAIDNAWNQELARIVMQSELDKLGMQIGKKELGDVLYGENAPQDLKQQFTDPKTGVYNPQLAKQQIDQMLKSKQVSAEQKAGFNSYVDQLEFMRLNEKYNSLLTNSTNFPKWLVEKQNADNSQLANISFARQFYTSIPDSSIKISDSEIQDYINKHKKEFKQEENRSISYVAFSALPTAADTNATRDKLLALKPELDSTKDLQQFLENQGVRNYYNGYINGKNIQIPVKDSIFKIPVGTVYGPYIDGGSYSLAKLVGVRTQPDTVKVRHILVATVQRDPQSGQTIPVRDSATAKKLIDSIQTAIASGSIFDTVAAKVSDDPGSKDKGGVYENITAGGMVPEFNDFIFGNPVGTKGVVKTEFGYHYIEILSQKGGSPAYKIAYLALPIEASQETDAAASNAATLFAGDSRDQKSFDANAEKLKAKGINKAFATEITPNAYQVMGLGVSRQFVKSIYDAKLGEVLQPERVGENYVVALVTEVNKKGTQSAAKARPLVEPLLRNHKKAEQIQKKLGTITSLEDAATKLGGATIETADSVRMSGTQASLVASEPKVIGAAFNPANKGKVVPQAIEGTSGVYVVRVNSVSATAIADANVAEQRKSRYQQAKMRGGYPQQVLMEAADIKDNRSKIY